MAPRGSSDEDKDACAATRITGLDFSGRHASDRRLSCEATTLPGGSCEYRPRGTSCVPWTVCPSSLHEWYRPEYTCQTVSGHNAVPERLVSNEAECQNGYRWTAAQPAICEGADGRPMDANNQTVCENSQNRWMPPEVREANAAAREAAAMAAAMEMNATNASLVDLSPQGFTCDLAPEVACSYWNPVAGRWMRDGIVLEKSPRYMLCSFNHLTDFGAMMVPCSYIAITCGDVPD